MKRTSPMILACLLAIALLNSACTKSVLAFRNVDTQQPIEGLRVRVGTGKVDAPYYACRTTSTDGTAVFYPASNVHCLFVSLATPDGTRLGTARLVPYERDWQTLSNASAEGAKIQTCWK